MYPFVLGGVSSGNNSWILKGYIEKVYWFVQRQDDMSEACQNSAIKSTGEQDGNLPAWNGLPI
jgi:hypothetical protein